MIPKKETRSNFMANFVFYDLETSFLNFSQILEASFIICVII